MNKYAVIKFRYGWIGTHQTSINIWNNFIIFHYSFIRSIEFGFSFGGFVFPDKFGGLHRDLIQFNMYKFDKSRRWHVSFSLLYIELIDRNV